MKKTILVFAVACLLSNAYASNNNIKAGYQFYDRMLEDYLLKKFCKGLKEGERCNVAEPLRDNVMGVCCDGRCRRDVESCSEKQPPGLEPVASIIKKIICFSKKQNEECFLRDGKTGKVLDGRCCDGMCYFGVRDCSEVEPEQEYGGMDVSVPELKERIKVLSCLGIPDNNKCKIPAEIADEYDLYGVCCSQKCCFRVDECLDESIKDGRDKDEGEGPVLFILLLAGFIIALVFIVLMLLVYRLLRKRTRQETRLHPSSRDYELELKRLQDEKKSVEEMMKLAQFKFRKRKLDEESFREIVRDQQKRLIEIEARIKEMEDRVVKLEKKHGGLKR